MQHNTRSKIIIRPRQLQTGVAKWEKRTCQPLGQPAAPITSDPRKHPYQVSQNTTGAQNLPRLRAQHMHVAVRRCRPVHQRSRDHRPGARPRRQHAHGVHTHRRQPARPHPRAGLHDRPDPRDTRARRPPDGRRVPTIKTRRSAGTQKPPAAADLHRAAHRHRAGALWAAAPSARCSTTTSSSSSGAR